MKKRICLIIIFCLMLPLLFIPASASNRQNTLDFITQNIGLLVNIYTQLHPDSGEVFEGTSIEFSIPVEVVSTGAQGMYLDFNGDNGYMVLADGNDVLEWEVTGDLEYLKELDSVYFSVIDGFGYYIDDTFISYEASENGNVGLPDVGTRFNGQNYDGEGGIYDTSSYIVDRYTSEYELDTFNWLINNFTYVRQGDYSIYEERTGTNTSVPEGNCALSTVYAAMNYLKSSGKCPSLPASYNVVQYNASLDPFYNEYANNDNYVINSPISLPVLYRTIRDHAISTYYYETGGFFSGFTASLIEDVADDYSANIDATLYSLGSFESCVRDEIDANNPVIFSVDLSTTYSSHAMTITGYRIFEKTTTILGIDFKDYVYLLRVADNWSTTSCYFDLTAFSGTWSYVTIHAGG